MGSVSFHRYSEKKILALAEEVLKKTIFSHFNNSRARDILPLTTK
jgi:hypothetical protein